MTEVIGKNGISAKIILDSISAVTGDRLTTMEITYPRFILAEFNTHRMFSRNSASSRAIPFAKMQENLTAVPVRFGQANKGMQDKGEDFKNSIDGRYEEYCVTSLGKHSSPCVLDAIEAWDRAKEDAMFWSQAFYNAGYHKQVYNRLTEPFQMMKTVVSATEWSNFFWLRDDDAADPSIAELARCMKDAYEQSEPQVLQAGEWHLPYVEIWGGDDSQMFGITHEKGHPDYPIRWITLEDAIKVSCARACAVSFRNTDYGLEKSKEVYERLISDSKIHGSALEHAAKVMQPYTYEWVNPNEVTIKHINDSEKSRTWEEGISHADRSGNLWSANFKGFVQHRKTIKGENYESK